MKLIKWNYETAVSQLKPMVEDIHKKTLSICKLLYEANVALTNSGYRSDLKNVTPTLESPKNRNSSSEMQTSCQVAQGSKPKTFIDFLEEIGLPKRTAYRWIASYDAVNDKLLSEEEVKERVQKAKDALFEEVRSHRYNGEPEWKPEKWTLALEKNYQLWLSERGYIKTESKYYIPSKPEPTYVQLGLFKQEYLDSLLQRTYERCLRENGDKFAEITNSFKRVVPKGVRAEEVAKISEFTIASLEQFPREARREIGLSLAAQIQNQVMEEF